MPRRSPADETDVARGAGTEVEAMEKRRTLRVMMMAELRYEMDGSSGGTITKRVTDLSEGGLFVDTPVPAEVGTILKLRFMLDGEPVEAEGRVAFAQAFIGMGVEFTTLAPASRERIRAYVARLAPEPVGV